MKLDVQLLAYAEHLDEIGIGNGKNQTKVTQLSNSLNGTVFMAQNNRAIGITAIGTNPRQAEKILTQNEGDAKGTLSRQIKGCYQ